MKILIDQKEVEFEPGETILQIAHRANIYIPHLCWLEGLKPLGACRLCWVEIKGRRGYTTACTTTAEEAMIVTTNSPQIQELRKGILHLILSEHPSSCLVCDKTKECKPYQECIQKNPVTIGCRFCSKDARCTLQELYENIGITDIKLDFVYRNLPVEVEDPFFERDYNLCVLCGRCVRVCQEVRGVGAISFINRGPQTRIGTAFEKPHLVGDCTFCGTCVNVCPTGALRERATKWEGVEDTYKESVCVFCNLHCHFEFAIKKGKIIRAVAENYLGCAKGKFGIIDMVYHPDRLKKPLLRDGTKFKEIGWDEALNIASEKLSSAGGSTGILFSPTLSVEDVDAILKFAGGVIKTKWIATSGEFFVPTDGFIRAKLDDLEIADIIIVLGTDISVSYPAMMVWLKKAIDNGAKLIEEYPKQTLLTKSALGQIPSSIPQGSKVIIICPASYLNYYHKMLEPLVKISTVRSIALASMHELGSVKGNYFPLMRALRQNQIDVLYLIGEMPIYLDKKPNFVIWQDMFLPQELVDYVDLVLPTVSFVETDGTYINCEGVEVKAAQVIQPLYECKTDRWILEELSKKFVIHTSQQKTNTLSAHQNSWKQASEFPFTLFIENNFSHYKSANLYSLLKGFRRIRESGIVEMNPADAEQMNLTDGRAIYLVSENGRIKADLKVNKKVKNKTLFISLHYGKNSPLQLINPERPEFIVPVKIEYE